MKLKNRSAVLSLTLIMAFRMLGLFMILPVFSAHAVQIPGATATLVGLALGIYGLTQAGLQMPFGWLSDRIGRKPIIVIGLLLFAAGSVVAALSHNITNLIIGRALQGAGAIGSTALALVADLTREENRNKAMAFLGLSIGMSFSVAMIIGPIVNSWFHLSGIFWLTAGLSLIGLTLLARVPTPPKLVVHEDVEATPNKLSAIFKNSQLLRLNFGIFSLHLMLTALFIAIPILLTHTLKLSQMQQTTTYLIVLVLAFITMIPFIIIAEKKRKMKRTFIGAVSTLLISQVLLYFFGAQPIIIGVLLFCFFTAFTLLEASLPSLISKIAPIQYKGTAMGVYSTSQFLGIFVGGSAGGLIFAHFGIHGIFFFCSMLALLWLIFAMTMRLPPYLSTLIFEAHSKGQEINQKLRNFPGVAEVSFSPSENLIYTKVDKQKIDEHELRKCIEEVNLS
ncbi:MAG: MFS transporter [Coxiellaceae bacterium]|nr:MFS transporter [Coxiellaceae bacterium]